MNLTKCVYMIASFYVSADADTIFICRPSSSYLQVATTRFSEISWPKFLIFFSHSWFTIYISIVLFIVSSGCVPWRFGRTPLELCWIHGLWVANYTEVVVRRVQMNCTCAVCSMSIKFSAFERFTLTVISITTTTAVALNACTQCVFNSTFWQFYMFLVHSTLAIYFRSQYQMRQMACHDENCICVLCVCSHSHRAHHEQPKKCVANRQANLNGRNDCVCADGLANLCLHVCVWDPLWVCNCLKNFWKRKIKVILAANS